MSREEMIRKRIDKLDASIAECKVSIKTYNVYLGNGQIELEILIAQRVALETMELESV